MSTPQTKKHPKRFGPSFYTEKEATDFEDQLTEVLVAQFVDPFTWIGLSVYEHRMWDVTLTIQSDEEYEELKSVLEKHAPNLAELVYNQQIPE